MTAASDERLQALRAEGSRSDRSPRVSGSGPRRWAGGCGTLKVSRVADGGGRVGVVVEDHTSWISRVQATKDAVEFELHPPWEAAGVTSDFRRTYLAFGGKHQADVNILLQWAAAIAEAIAQAMDTDPRVFVMGEDIARYGGIFSATSGLLQRFGPERVMDTPISETAFIGAATGAAAEGLRPIVELMFVDFFGVCMDQIYNHLAKNTYMSGGSVKLPVVLMTAIGGGYLLFAADAGSLFFLRSEHVQCHMPRCGQYLRRIPPVDRAIVLFHGDIQYPMQLVFDAPMTAHPVGKLLFG